MERHIYYKFVNFFNWKVCPLWATVEGDQGVGGLHTLSFTCQGHSEQASQILGPQSAVKGRNSARGLLFSRKERETQTVSKAQSTDKNKKIWAES